MLPFTAPRFLRLVAEPCKEGQAHGLSILSLYGHTLTMSHMFSTYIHQDVCEDFKCQTVGEKCEYVKDVGPRCVCRENEDCRALYEPVCGSDSRSYNSHCIMSATACRTGKVITMVNEGGCLPGNSNYFRIEVVSGFDL